MTRKDYQAIADAIREVYEDYSGDGVAIQYQAHETLNYTLARLCQVFAQDNPRFSADKFVKACGEYAQAN